MTFNRFRCIQMVASLGTLGLLLLSCKDAYGFNFNGTCEQTRGSSVSAYTHWPFSVNCDGLKEAWKTRNDSGEKDTFECSIFHNGTKNDEGLFELSDLSENVLYQAELVVNGTNCLAMNITVDLQPFPEETCVESTGRNHRNLSHTMDDYVQLHCESPAGSPDIIPKEANRKDFETAWITRCGKKDYRNNNGWQNVPPPEDRSTDPDTLDMPRVDFYDATNFTCSVKYGGRTLYIITYEQCIKQKINSISPTVICTKEETKAPGENAVFDCTGQMVIGKTLSENLKIEWKKNDKTICKIDTFDRNTTGVNSRYTCNAHDETNNESLKCLSDYKQGKDEEIQEERKKIDMKFYLSDVKAEDYGASYIVVFSIRDDKGNWQSVEQEITLKEDKSPFIKRIITILASVLAVLVVLLIAAFVIYRYRIYIFVWYKRTRMSYDRDDKHYVGYLSYLYDSENAVKSLEATKRIVFAIQSVMDELGYKYYDEQREGGFGAEVEKITNLIENSHRMVIVLTEEYLDDKWKRFHAELGFHGLLESRVGLIFILTPGVKKALRKRAKHDKVWYKLLIALKSKSQKIINWKEKMSDDELKKHIEYTLPKLDRKRRSFSISADPETGLHFKNDVAYERSMSQATQCTLVSPDTAQENAI